MDISRTLLTFIMLAVLSIFTSCSSLLYENARHSKVLRHTSTRFEVRRALGKPIETGVVSSDKGFMYAGQPTDKFHVTGSVYDREKADVAAIGAVLSFGIADIVSFPGALRQSFSRSKKEVLVIYDDEERYVNHKVRVLSEDKSEQDAASDR